MIFVAFQLVILAGLLAIGIYIIITDEEMLNEIPQNQDNANLIETDPDEAEMPIKFPDVAYIQYDCVECEGFITYVAGENNSPDVLEDI